MSRKEYQQAKYIERRETHKRVTVTMTVSEYNAFNKICKAEGGITIPKLLLKMATAYRTKSYFVPEQLKKQVDSLRLLIRNIASNINQISHSSNIFHQAEKQGILKHLVSLTVDINDFVNKELEQGSSNLCHVKNDHTQASNSFMITSPGTMVATQSIVSRKILSLIVVKPFSRSSRETLNTSKSGKMEITSTMK